MERTSFTTNRSWMLGILTLVLGLAGFQSASAQCPVPTIVGASNFGQNTATLSWTSNDTPMDNCWVLSVGGMGMTTVGGNCPAAGQALSVTTICNFGGTLTWTGTAVTGVTQAPAGQINATVGGLPPGTDLEFYVSETCDGISPPANVSDCAGAFAFQTLDAQYTVTATAVRPTCPFGSPLYAANGSFTVTVADGTTCAGTYTVNAAPVAGSGPMGSTPPLTTVVTYIGFGAGNFLFANAGAGSYTVTVTETGSCNPATDPVVITVVVPDGIDTQAPNFFVTDFLGNIILDSEGVVAPSTLTVDVTLPEGACGRQDQYRVFGFDNCHGAIFADGAVTATAVTTPATIDPSTQVAVVPTGSSFWGVDVHWSIGTTTLTIEGRDFAGNVATMTITANVADNTLPVVSILGNSQFTIPVCATSVTGILTFQIDDRCDQDVDIANLTVNFGGATGVLNFPGTNYFEYFVTFPSAGEYLISGSYTDDFGNVGFFDQVITVQQAAADQPPVIIANAENASISACQTSYPNFIYSFVITDDCQPIPNNLAGLSITGLPAGMTFFYGEYINTAPFSAYLEFIGNVAPGTYFPSITYTNSAGQTANANPSIRVTREPNQPADIVLPAINVTIPQCESSIATIIPIHIFDDCDSPISTAANRLSISLGGVNIPVNGNPDVFVNAAAGYIEISRTLTAANSGQLLLVSYTDGSGATSVVDAGITVTAQPDNFRPIIVYPSQDIILNLDACETADQVVSFGITFTDNCGVTASNVSASGGTLGTPAAGSNIYTLTVPAAQATYTVTSTASDAAGNTRTEVFRVIVNKPARPVDNLACINFVTVTLGPDCTARLIPDMVLTGNRGCITDDMLEIVVVDGLINGAVVDGCGDFIYEIRLRDGFPGFNFTTCWGYVKAEDKTRPTITCPAPVSQYLGRDLICTDLNNVLFTSPVQYFTDRNGTPLAANRQPANYIATLNKLDLTGRPQVADNCGNLRVTVTDAVADGGNCGNVVITRTFLVEDKQFSPCAGTPNFAECTQTITIRKPTLADVVLPPAVVELECSATVNSGAANPGPAVTGGYPTIRTAFATHNIGSGNNGANPYCNLAAQFVDQPRVDACGPGSASYKFIRRWTVLDWCAPTQSLTRDQLIKVGDNTPPVVTCPVILDPWGVPQNPPTYSTTPFSCTASFAVPMPTVTDVCSEWSLLSEIITDVTVPVLNQYGQQIGTQVQTIVVRTIPQGGNRNVTGIPVGDHKFRYTATDRCGNVTSITCDFRVRDFIEPNAVCDDQLNISIGGQGFARVYASDIDEGSNDNCGDITIEVRRAVGCASTAAPFTPWGDFIDFSCCDAAGPNSRVRIELRVTDGSGNQNICWLDVLVEDKIRPFCYAPHPVSINCDALPYDFNPRDTVQLAQLFNGSNPPSATDNCTAYVRELAPTVNLHDCGWGTIIRNFQATDQAGNTSTNNCRQTITINENHNYWIKFPRDYSANCGDPNPAGVEYEEIGCDLLAVSTTDERFAASGDECYKIFRTYRVINWCEYNGQDAPVVVGRDEECNAGRRSNDTPGYALKNAAGQLVTDPWFPNNGIYVIVRGTTGTAKTSWYDSDTNPSNNLPQAGWKVAVCDGLVNPAGHWVSSTQKPSIASRGFWQYTQHIIVYDNVRPTITVPPVQPFCSYDSPTSADPTCEGPVTIPFSVNELCTPNDVTIKVFLDAFRDGTFPFDFNVRLNPNGTRTGNTNVFTINGSYPNYTIVSTTPQGLPIGQHRFEIHAEDGCGNAQSILVNFEVRDCKAPTPICYNGLTVTLMPIDTNNDGTPDAGMAEVWASDFIASPVVDCSPPVRYSIRLTGQAPDRNRLGVTFDCNSPANTVVFIDAWDAVGNRDFCETYVLVQDQTGICAGPATGSIAGTISTEASQPVQGVNVAVSGPMSQNTQTNVSGSYLLNNLTTGGDYTVTPVLDANYLNGVSTFDLVLISRHILGVQLLDSPYKMIAADVNNSRSITTLDLIQLRRLILAIDTQFANNTSWRFIPASYSFPVPTNPWFEQFPEVININNLPGNMINQNFRAVKIGDVNGSVVPNLTAVEDRTMRGEFALNVTDQQVKAGNEYVVTFTGEQMESIRGYQATLTFGSGLELVDVVYGAAKEENFGMRFAGEGAITMSWNGEAKSADNLFSLVFRANAEGRLSEMLGVSSRYTRAEAYNVNNDLMGVSLNFGGTLVSEGFELYQNQPNPFKGQTVIGYNLPEAAYVTLTVQDAAGKVLRVVRNEGVKGYNQLTLNSNELPASGVMYYTIATEGFTATKKMIVVQ